MYIQYLDDVAFFEPEVAWFSTLIVVECTKELLGGFHSHCRSGCGFLGLGFSGRSYSWPEERGNVSVIRSHAHMYRVTHTVTSTHTHMYTRS